MAIKNYTTTKEEYESIAEIQLALAKHGARKIMIDYAENGDPQGVTFAVNTPCGYQGYILPANTEGVLAAFARQKIKADRNQAQRTAWRNVRDWIMAQMAFIESGNVDMPEVFFPYMAVGKGVSVYQLYNSGQLCLPEGDKK